MCSVKNVYKLLFLWCVWLPTGICASDTVTITAPTNGGTVSGTPLIVTGTSSQASAQVQFIFNSVDIGSLTTDESGNFSHTFASLEDGDYDLTVNLLDNNLAVLATDSITFTIENAPTITVTMPQNDEIMYSTICIMLRIRYIV